VFRKIDDLNKYLSFSMFHIGRKTDDVRSLYVCENKDPTRRTHIQLGLISENGNNQFVLIKDMSKLFLSLKQRRDA